MTEMTEQKEESPLDILRQLDDERNDVFLMLSEIKTIIRLCKEYTGHTRPQDDMEWFLVFSNIDRSAEIIEQSLSKIEVLTRDCEQKAKKLIEINSRGCCKAS